MKSKTLLFLTFAIAFMVFAPVISAADSSFGSGPENILIEDGGSVAKKVSCGNVTEIPRKIPELTSLGISIVQISVPVILVLMGSMDLFKGITAQKEDEIKKGQQLFIKRLIIGASIFFVIVIAKLLISVIADASSANIIECVDCFLSNKCVKEV